MIVIPPFSQLASDPITPLPTCFRDYPTAVINYRWQAAAKDEPPEIPLHWPTPLHDVSFGYAWITDNLGSTTALTTEPRPAYVYGSYLGASLAASLALTECRMPTPAQSMTIRGLIAHNGIYNWTMFLPDHPIHNLKPKSASRRTKGLLLPRVTDHSPVPVEEEGIFAELKDYAPDLFSVPSNMFDPFASPCFFFHSANLHVPDDFTTPLFGTTSLSAEFTAAVDKLASSSPTPTAPSSSAEEESADDLLARATTIAKQLKPPRKGYLAFPPRDSLLRIPSSLFLHDRPHNYSPTTNKKGNPTTTTTRNNFTTQATDLIGLMMRSLDMHELKSPSAGGRAPWEWESEDLLAEDSESLVEREYARAQEIQKRVQSFEVEGPDLEMEGGGKGLGLGEVGEEVVGEWLRERVEEDFGE